MHVSDGISGGDVRLTNFGPSSLCDITREHGVFPRSIARLDPGESGSMWLTDESDTGDAIRFRRCGSATQFFVRVYGYRDSPARLDLDERDGLPCVRRGGSEVCDPAEVLFKGHARSRE